jgi:transposase InsO family protein
MRYRFIDQHRAVWPIEVQCRVLEVSRSGYYAWRTRPESPAAKRRAELTDRIRQIHKRPHHANYGAPRIHRELLAQGHPCNRKTVERLMCRASIRARTCRRFRVVTTDSRHALPIAPNRLARQFQPAARHQAWTMDITYIATDEGWLYLALVEDLYSRKIVGWAMSERIDSELVTAALNMALAQERPKTGLLAHSDRGVQYASDRFQTILAQHGIVCSMSRKANCWDNAPTESLVATIKKELVHQQHYATRDQARHALFEYIEVFYNRQRRHSALDYRTPHDVHHALAPRHREEGRGAGPAAPAVGGERGLVSPQSKKQRGEAAPLITTK